MAHRRRLGRHAPVSVGLQRQLAHLPQFLRKAHQARNEVGAALETGRRHRDLPALVQIAQERILRHEDVFEKHLAELGVSGDLPDGFDTHARAAHVHQQKTQALVPGCLGIRSRQHEAPIRTVGERRPDLVAVQAKAPVGRLRPRAYGRQVGPGARLGIPLAPDLAIGKNAGQEAALLRLGAKVQKRRRENAVADQVHAQRRAAARVLFVKDRLAGQRQVFSAMGLGPAQARPSVGAKGVFPRPPVIQTARVGAAGPGPGELGVGGFQPTAQAQAKGRVILRVVFPRRTFQCGGFQHGHAFTPGGCSIRAPPWPMSSRPG